MIFITGDTHGGIDCAKLMDKKLNRLCKNDYLLIAGDFGYCWFGDDGDGYHLDELEKLPYSILFIDGNHENFDILNSYPEKEWNGGTVHEIRPHVLHLMRSNVFNICGNTFFTMGGGDSSDKEIRKDGVSWWKEEIPSIGECNKAISVLDAVGWNVDYVITHSAPDNILNKINPHYKHNILTNLLFVIDKDLKFKKWYFGHYHEDKDYDDLHTCLYQKVVKVGDGID